MGTIMDTEGEWRNSDSLGWSLGSDVSTSPTPAVRGVSRGEEGWTGARRGENLAPFLGWFSIGLGLMEIVAPGEITRFVGLRPSERRSTIVRAMGAREIAAGIGILGHPRSEEWLRSRIGGDAFDLALLALALTRSEKPQRTWLATAVVLGAAALDIFATEQVAQNRKAPTPRALESPGTYLRKSVTVARPVAEVYAFWRDFTNLPVFMRHLESVEILSGKRSRWRAAGPAQANAEWDAELVEDLPGERIAWRSLGGSDLYNAGTVYFSEAPAHEGTIVTVEMQYAPPGGMIGAAMLKLLRMEPGQQLGDDLRRFKQVLETGEVVLSDPTAVRGTHAGRPSARMLSS